MGEAANGPTTYCHHHVAESWLDPTRKFVINHQNERPGSPQMPWLKMIVGTLRHRQMPARFATRLTCKSPAFASPHSGFNRRQTRARRPQLKHPSRINAIVGRPIHRLFQGTTLSRGFLSPAKWTQTGRPSSTTGRTRMKLSAAPSPSPWAGMTLPSHDTIPRLSTKTGLVVERLSI